MGFGVEVEDVDEVPDALAEHRLVRLRSGALELEEQVALTARLGRVVGSAPGVPQVRYEDDRRMSDPDHIFFNEQWHADLSWCAEGPSVTVLYAVAASRWAAPTGFVDTVSGFARLDPARQAAAAGWTACHHVERSRVVRHGRGSPAPSAPAEGLPLPRPGHGAHLPTFVDEPGARHEVVVLDPQGRPGVALGDHAWTLAGVDEAEGIRLVDGLQDAVVASGERVVHRWRPGDLVAFDGRTVLHRREPSRRLTRRRLLRRTVAWP